MKSQRLLLALLVLPLAAGSAPPAVSPDVIPEGMHRIKFVLSVDAAAVAACPCRAYQMMPGDTYAEIARRECGDARCAEEISLLNPQVSPDRLRPGDYLRIPPRTAVADSQPTTRASGSSRACWVPFVLQWGRSRVGAEWITIVEGEPIDAMGRGEIRVVAVPREKLREFLGMKWDGVEIDHLPDGVVGSDAIRPTWLLPATDAAITVEKRVTLRNSKDQSVRFDIEERRLDKQGRLVTQSRDQRTGPSLASLPLAAIGIGALLSVIGLARRRRASSLRRDQDV